METDNAVALQGILKELRKVDNINTLPFNGYELTVITERRSGALDETIVYAQSNNVDSIQRSAARYYTARGRHVRGDKRTRSAAYRGRRTT